MFCFHTQKDAAVAGRDCLLSASAVLGVPLYLSVAMDLNRGFGQNGHLPWCLQLVCCAVAVSTNILIADCSFYMLTDFHLY